VCVCVCLYVFVHACVCACVCVCVRVCVCVVKILGIAINLIKCLLIVIKVLDFHTIEIAHLCEFFEHHSAGLVSIKQGALRMVFFVPERIHVRDVTRSLLQHDSCICLTTCETLICM